MCSLSEKLKHLPIKAVPQLLYLEAATAEWHFLK